MGFRTNAFMDFTNGYALVANYFINRTFHVKLLLIAGVVLAIENFSKCADRIGEIDVFARSARKRLRHEERLREEALNLSSAIYKSFIIFRKLFNAENRDDVLQVFVALQDAARFVSNAIVFFTNDFRLKRRRAGFQ